MFSFDIFETTLLRDVLTPTDLFYRIGARASERNEATNPVSLSDFVSFRIKAEQIARTESTREETTLEAIWRNLVTLLGWDWTSEWMEVEMAAEAAALRPIQATRQRIEAARAKEGRVLFISDQYLPASFLKTQLQRFHLFQENDRLYVSSEVGLLKSSGNLFRHVLAQEGLSASQLHHYGDNLYTDIKMARSIGIEATLCTQPELTANEAAIVEHSALDSRLLHSVVGASRQFRCTREDTQEHALQNAGTQELTGSFLGPFCTLFAAWALQSAQQQGLKRLYFCARDCQLVWVAAKILAPLYGNIDCRYLYLSRQALQLPSVTVCQREEMPWLWRSFEKPLLERVLSKLELSKEDVPEGIGTYSEQGVVLNESDWDKLWQTLESPPLKAKVEARARQRREAAVAYFSNEGLFELDHVGIVDLGWSLTCKASLRKILQAAGFSGELYGYYLGLDADRQPPAATGPTSAICYDAPSNLARFSPIFQHKTLIEHIVGQATHPSTVRYSSAPDTGPVFQNVESDPERDRIICSLHQEVAHYASLQKTNLTAEPVAIVELQNVLCALITSFFYYGSREAITTLEHIKISRDQKNAGSQSLLLPLTWGEVIKELLPGRFYKGGEDQSDTSLALARRFASSPAVNFAFHGVRQMKHRVKQIKLRR